MKCYERLKELRLCKKLTQEQLGKFIGVSQRTISHYESGLREPGINEIKQYAKYFNVSADYIICLTDNPEPNYRIKTQVNVQTNKGNININ